jgi:hypothetical protein
VAAAAGAQPARLEVEVDIRGWRPEAAFPFLVSYVGWVGGDEHSGTGYGC